ncbi:MAG: HlyC/CorC family transporter [Myxococcales bacterium]|nr:HlyC/CorC family transporter [Myxococcales bacterium]
MSDLMPYLAVLGALVVCSAFFSGTEVAMFSLRRSDRELLGQSERKADKLILRILSRPRALLATLLIGNESVNVAISAVMAGFIDSFFHTGSELQNAVVATSLALPLLLFFGEIGPKSIAYGKGLGWSRKSVRFLWFFGFVITPIRFLVRGISDVVLGPLAGKKGEADISEEEFKVLVDAGSAEGAVNDRERRLIHNVFAFGDKTVAEAMRRRGKVFALAYELPIARLVKEIAARGYSRVPIYDRSIDNIRGVLYAKDLVIASCRQSPPNRLSDLLHEPFWIPQTTTLSHLFSIFKQGKTHMALVVDEYGTLVGIVTMEDLLEELFGDIKDERELQKSMASKLRTPTEPIMPAGGGA